MSNDVEEFKRGFAAYCFEAGLSQEKAAALIEYANEKRSNAAFARLLAGLASGARGLATRARSFLPSGQALRNAGTATVNAAKSPTGVAIGTGAGILGLQALSNAAASAPAAYADYVIPGALAIGGAAGLGAGHIGGNWLAAATENTSDPEEIKAKELADTYRAYARRAEVQREIKQRR